MQKKEAYLIPGSGRTPGEGNSNALQYSSLENPMDRAYTHYSPWGCKRLNTHTIQNYLILIYIFKLFLVSQYFYKHARTLYITLLSHIFCRKHLRFCPMPFYFDYNIFSFMDRCVSMYMH